MTDYEMRTHVRRLNSLTDEQKESVMILLGLESRVGTYRAVERDYQLMGDSGKANAEHFAKEKRRLERELKNLITLGLAS